MPITWYKALVTNIVDETPHVKRFFMKVQGLETFDFLAGQFITLDLPISEKRLNRWRSYSIANRPDGGNVIELCVVKKYDGQGSKYLFEQIDIGSELVFKGPDGNFVTPKDIYSKEVVMICTGTGVAPFRSMLLDIHSKQLAFKKIHLIFGTRHAEDVLYGEEFQKLALELSDFTYDVSLSREKHHKYAKGYVHQIYMDQYQHKRDDVLFMLCGWSAMIDEAVAKLIIDLGYDKKQIIYELYG